MRRLLVMLCSVGMWCGAVASGWAQTGTIRGTITDASNGAPLPGATVSVGGGRQAVSGPSGEYVLSGIPAGAATVTAALIGYAEGRQGVTVASGAAATANFALQPTTIRLEGITAIVGSRAQHTAEDELAVAVDVIPSTTMREQGVTETAQILQSVSPSVNFFRQSVSDGTDIVRPFTMRGLSPDHTLVLLNGKRYHRTALVHIYGAGMGAGSSGVDLNTLPASAVDRIEVLRDGAAAQYGSDAIAGVVNVVLKQGAFSPEFTADVGRYQPNDWGPDGETVTVGGGMGFPVGRGWIALFGEFRNREATNRAGADPEDQLVPGDADLVEDGKVVEKNNPVPQPTYHWGDGVQRDYLGFVNALFPLDAQLNHQAYAFGGYGWRNGIGNGYFRHGISERNWPQIYPQGFLPEFAPHVVDATASVGVRGLLSGWRYDAGATWGHNLYRFNIANSLNTSLGPCLDTPCAPGADGVLGTQDDPGIPNQTEFDAGALSLYEAILGVDFSRGFEVGLASPLNVAVGAAFRHEIYTVEAGEPASFIQGWHPDRNGDIAPPGSQVFPGFRPANEADEARHNVGGYVDLEADVAPRLLANVAARFESYSDFGEAITGKVALRYQPSARWTLRGALSTGFRAPSLSQSWYGSTSTNFAPDETTGDPVAFDVGFFPVASEAARALGARPLREETSINASAGFAVTPADGLNLAVDYFFIDLDDRIMLTTDLAGPEVEAILEARGLSVQAARYFTNVVHTQTQGVDVTADWRIPLSGARALRLNAVLNWTKTDIVDDIPLPPELEGTGTVLIDPFWEGGLLALERERPRWRTAVSGRYETGDWGFLGRASSYGKYESALYCYCEETVQEYRSQTLFDVEASRNFTGRGKLAIGVRNLFDTFPPKMIEDNSFGIFIYPPASPFGYNGRFIYARMEFGIGR